MTDERREWQAGAAIVPFPVAIGTPLAGYMARTGPATGTNDELTVGALVLEREGRRLAIVAADVVALDAPLVDVVAAATGLDRSEVVLCASHTHGGPAGIVARLHPAQPDQLDPELRAAFVTACKAAIQTALARQEPVALLTGAAETNGVAANRNDPAGPYDPRLSLLATRRPDGSLQAILVHFACHPTVLGAENRLVSADFPGAVRQARAATLGHGDPIIFYVNGAAGDVSTHFTRRGQDFAEVERVGTSLAESAKLALIGARPVDGPLRYRRSTVSLPPRPPDEIAAALAAAHSNDEASGTLTAEERQRAETRRQGATMLAHLARVDTGLTPATLDLEAWLLGDIALLAVPGELFASLGQRIVAASPPALVLGYANGYVGYLADEAAYATGTYEALASPFAAGTGERVAEAAADLLATLRREAGADCA